MKIRSLQVLRAIAAWLVVYHHYMQMFYDFKSDTILGHFFSKYGSFGVDIFFVISGFVMFNSATKASASGWSFFVNRLFRVFPAYWFFTVLLLVVSLLLPNTFSFTSYTLESLTYSLLFIPHANPSGLGVFPFLTVGWTLNYEISFYTILALCLALTKRYAIYLCGILILIIPIILLKNDSSVLQVLSSPLLWQFNFGMLVGLIYKKTRLTILMNSFLSSLLIILSLALLFSTSGYEIINKTIAAALIVIAFIGLDKSFSKESRILSELEKLGDHSYSTYLCHVMIIGIALHFSDIQMGLGVELLTLSLISIMIYATSAYSYRIIENSSLISRIRELLVNIKGK